MQLWPAIDLLGGKCVRLRQGDYGQETIFSDRPADIARRWCDEGASGIHLVDLDGARDGTLVNLPVVEAIRAAVSIPCQLGGGVREEANVKRLRDLGIDRLIIGTRALRDPAWFRQLSTSYPQQLILGLDARDGFVATAGWLETSTTAATALARSFADLPLAAVVYTDIAKDGMLTGPNVPSILEMMSHVPVPLIASGGITTLDDIRELCGHGVPACIIGRALYEGSISLPQAVHFVQHFLQTGTTSLRP